MDCHNCSLVAAAEADLVEEESEDGGLVKCVAV